jgi:hypothetical protein
MRGGPRSEGNKWAIKILRNERHVILPSLKSSDEKGIEKKGNLNA